ncbi:MAG: DNA polymerase IV [Hyphomicrobiales bacterium]|nr:DNA polymerase IV [Hyphomicrobiales bacterium]
MSGAQQASRLLSCLCRDCFHRWTAAPPAAPGASSRTRRLRCENCGSPRTVAHDELEELTIAHIDCDAFYAAIEKRDDPSLNDKPLIIGGGTRGVVSTCCYIARTFGVHSAMPMFKARSLCPQAVIIRPDMAKYAAVGRQVRAMMQDLTPLVEPLSIDEAFLDLSGTHRLHHAPPAETLARFAGRAESDLGITVSVGLSYCKFLAKIASDIDKPRGYAVIGRVEAVSFLEDKPAGMIWGVGKVARERLERAGIRTIGDIQRLDETTAIRRFGTEGQRLWRLSRGIDNRPVSSERDTKSISAESTFNTDISDPHELSRILYGLCEKVAARMKKQDYASANVTLKLKTKDFRTRTRARMLAAPTQLSGRIFEAANALLTKEATGTQFRLIGVGVSHLVPPSQADLGDLADTSAVREKAAETAIDQLRAKFGQGAIVKGITLPRR